MNVVIACERSRAVARAFNALGHWALSIDLEPADDPEEARRAQRDDMLGGHFQGDVFEALDGLREMSRPIDLLIAHPECTYLSGSGLHWNKRVPGRAAKTEAALEFVRKLDDQRWIPRACIENPVGAIHRVLGPATQYVQPYQFGHNASKNTGLWLRNLPPLKPHPAQYIAPRAVCSECKHVGEAPVAAYTQHPMFTRGCPKCFAEADRIRPRWANQTDSGQNKLGPSPTRRQRRAETYSGIADCMARTWGTLGKCTGQNFELVSD